MVNSVEKDSRSDATIPDIVRYEDLHEYGLTRYSLEQLISAGEFERSAPGVFVRAGLTDDTTAAWMSVAAKRPEATLCLLSALWLHDLTDEIPARSDIAVPRGTQPITVHHAPIAWHGFDTVTFGVGRTEHALPAGLSIGLYSAERTLIDVFRLRHVWGGDLAVVALRRWLRGRGNSPGSLLAVADGFPKARPAIQQALDVLL